MRMEVRGVFSWWETVEIIPLSSSSCSLSSVTSLKTRKTNTGGQGHHPQGWIASGGSDVCFTSSRNAR